MKHSLSVLLSGLFIGLSTFVAYGKEPVTFNLVDASTLGPEDYMPTLTIYPADKPNGRAVVVCPGGGYGMVAADHEGRAFAPWFNERGITEAVLVYRLPHGRSEVPLSDLRRALELLRADADKWGIDPDKIGVMGSSAGGHLAASAATLLHEQESRPDFAVLLYPVIAMSDSLTTHSGSRKALFGSEASSETIRRFSPDLMVDSLTPPTFIALSADDDGVNPENSVRLMKALIKNHVPVEMHVYPSGGHGWGFNDFPYHRQWLDALDAWLKDLDKVADE